MRKKIYFSLLASVVIVAISTWIWHRPPTPLMNDLVLNNIEALAENETGTQITCFKYFNESDQPFHETTIFIYSCNPCGLFYLVTSAYGGSTCHRIF